MSAGKNGRGHATLAGNSREAQGKGCLSAVHEALPVCAAIARGWLVLRLQLLPDPNFVRVGWRMAACANRAVGAPILTDVCDHLRFAHLFPHWREQYHRRLTTRVRAFQKHNIDGKIVRESRRVDVLKILSFRLYARLRQLAAHGTRIVYVSAGLRGHCLKPNKWFESGKQLTRAAQTAATDDVTHEHITHT
jgi:hypothetical protein